MMPWASRGGAGGGGLRGYIRPLTVSTYRNPPALDVDGQFPLQSLLTSASEG